LAAASIPAQFTFRNINPLPRDRDRGFESISLQRRVRNEPDPLAAGTPVNVQRLHIARRELALEAAIAKLDKFHLLILDDLAYVTKDQAETSVLFELISARYERRSLSWMATSCTCADGRRPRSAKARNRA
jgi:hypothetical protein